MVRLGQWVPDIVCLKDHVEAHLAVLDGVAVARLLGELNARRWSPFRFRQTGWRRRDDGSHANLVIAPLPVAAAYLVWPADTGDPLGGSSEI